MCDIILSKRTDERHLNIIQNLMKVLINIVNLKNNLFYHIYYNYNIISLRVRGRAIMQPELSSSTSSIPTNDIISLSTSLSFAQRAVSGLR